MWYTKMVSVALRGRGLCTLETPTPRLNAMLKSCLEQGRLTHLRRLFHRYPSSRNLASWNILLDAYVRYASLHVARQLFDQMPLRDVVSWNTFFSAFLNNHQPHSSYHYYRLLLTSPFRPNHYTFSILVTSFLSTSYRPLIPQLHSHILSLGYNSNAFVGSALIRAYTHLGDHSALCSAFRDVFQKRVTVWNAFILGHMELGLTLEARRAFDRMPFKNVVSWTTMIDGYLKNKQPKQARYIFDNMDQKNVVSWTAMISGYVKLGKHLNALELFPVMMRSGTRPNQHTFSSMLAACAGNCQLFVGEQLHVSILKHGIIDEIVVLTALVGMYATCGSVEAAYYIFKTMPKKNLASWNTMIGGFARHGLVIRAMAEFEELLCTDLRPDQTTFVHVLSACARGGKVVEGENMFFSMKETYGVPAEKEHYACMVDLYGRAGLLDKAESLIKGMPFEPDIVVWGALLGASALHSDSLFSSNAADAILKLERDNPCAYSLLSKIYGDKGVWSSLTHIKNIMKENIVKKQKAGSWIDY